MTSAPSPSEAAYSAAARPRGRITSISTAFLTNHGHVGLAAFNQHVVARDWTNHSVGADPCDLPHLGWQQESAMNCVGEYGTAVYRRRVAASNLTGHVLRIVHQWTSPGSRHGVAASAKRVLQRYRIGTVDHGFVSHR